MNPLVSIIIPLYNRENLIIETLESVFSQTYNKWECVIVDDGSTDNSYKVVEEYIKNKNRFKLYKRPESYKRGGTGARNFGYFQCSGEYIMWLDSDDLIEKNKIKYQVSDLLEYNADLSITKWKYFPEHILDNRCATLLFEAKKTDCKNVIKSMGKEESFFMPHCYLIKREVITKSGLWLEDLHINQDGEFYTRVLINSKLIILNKETYALYRIHLGERVSGVTSISKLKEKLISWKLIEANLKLIDEEEFNDYINKKKHIVFNQLIKNKHRTLIYQNKDFFKKQIKDNSLLRRIKIKINSFLKKITHF